MDRFKKPSFAFRVPEVRRQARHAEALKTRTDSRFKRLSMIRGESSPVSEPVKTVQKENNKDLENASDPPVKKTEFKNDKQPSSKALSRMEMLIRYKQEKQIKKELDGQKVRPFYAGSRETSKIPSAAVLPDRNVSFLQKSGRTAAACRSKIATPGSFVPGPKKSQGYDFKAAVTKGNQKKVDVKPDAIPSKKTGVVGKPTAGLNKVTPGRAVQIAPPKVGNPTSSKLPMPNQSSIVSKIAQLKISSAAPKQNNIPATKALIKSASVAKPGFSKLPNQKPTNTNNPSLTYKPNVSSYCWKGSFRPEAKCFIKPPKGKPLVSDKKIQEKKLAMGSIKETTSVLETGISKVPEPLLSENREGSLKNSSEPEVLEVEKGPKTLVPEASALSVSFAPNNFQFDLSVNCFVFEDDPFEASQDGKKEYLSRTSTPSKEGSAVIVPPQRASLQKISETKEIEEKIVNIADSNGHSKSNNAFDISSEDNIFMENTEVLINDLLDSTSPKPSESILVNHEDQAIGDTEVSMNNIDLRPKPSESILVNHEDRAIGDTEVSMNNIDMRPKPSDSILVNDEICVISDNLLDLKNMACPAGVQDEAGIGGGILVDVPIVEQKVQDRDGKPENEELSARITLEVAETGKLEIASSASDQGEAAGDKEEKRSDAPINGKNQDQGPVAVKETPTDFKNVASRSKLKKRDSLDFDLSEEFGFDPKEVLEMVKALNRQDKEDKADTGKDSMISSTSTRMSTGAIPKRVSILRSLSILDSISESTAETASPSPKAKGKPAKTPLNPGTTPRRSARLSSLNKSERKENDTPGAASDLPGSFFTPRRSMRLRKAVSANEAPLAPENSKGTPRRRSMRLINLNTPESLKMSTSITSEFEKLRLTSEDQDLSVFDVEAEKSSGRRNSKRISLLYSPVQRMPTRKSIKGDLISFSPSS